MAQGGGVRPQWPRTSRSGNPLPHSLSLQLCRGLANGKRKLGQRKRRQAPRLKNPDKRRGPPALAARPPGAWHRCPGRCPWPWQPSARPDPLTTFLLPVLCPGQLPLQPPSRPPADVSAAVPRGARAVCPRLCPRSGDAATPALLPPPRQRLDPPPFLDQRPHLGGPGLRARRDPDQAEGDSIHRAAGEALWPGHCWGRRQGPGRGGTEGAGSNAEGGVCLRSAPCAPDGAHPLPLAGLDAYRRAEFGVVADRASRRETVSGRQFGLAQPRKDDPGRQAKRMRAQNTGLASTERGRQGGRNGKGSREKQSQTERIRNRDGEIQTAGERQRPDRDRERQRKSETRMNRLRSEERERQKKDLGSLPFRDAWHLRQGQRWRRGRG